MSEQEALAVKTKSGNILTKTLRAVRGDDTQQLVEAFTSEMTLVAEGLCDDQARVRHEVEDIRREQEHLAQLIDSQMVAQDTGLQETQQSIEKSLRDVNRRLDALEAQLKRQETEKADKTKKIKAGKEGLIRQLTWLAVVIGGSWIIVTALNLLK